jgi:hypothetical protein
MKAFATAREIADEYGFSQRYWTRLAAAGKLPGAYQPGGDGGQWMFDRAAFRRWWSSTQRRVRQWPGYTSEDRSGGRAPSVRAGSTDGPLEQEIDELLKSACNNG